MTAIRAMVAFISAFVLACQPAMAFDRVVHHDVVYAVAVAHGLSVQEAALIANASYSLDENDTSTAYSASLIAQERAAILKGAVSLSELQHERSGQVFHALTKERLLIEKAHIARIQRVLGDRRELGTEAEKKRRALLYFGQYLHFVADMVVHPDDPLLGHGLEATRPDRADVQRDRMLIAIALLGDKVRTFQRGGLAPTRDSQLTTFPRNLHEDQKNDIMLRRVAGAVVDSWTRTYTNPWLDAADINVPGVADRKFFGLGGEQRQKNRIARASSEIARVLNSSGYTFALFRKIELDIDGEAAGADATAFGPFRRVEVLPFATTLANRAELRTEREYASGVQAFRASASAAVQGAMPPGAGIAATLVGKLHDDVRKAGAWVPPAGPGGVALNPRLAMPGNIGVPKRLTLDGQDLVLETSSGRYPIDGVSARSFATIARTIAVGQIPFITIGTEPSDRSGYARVSYAPALEGTAEGATLYLADVQFKGIFANFPFGAGYALNRAGDELVAGFPNMGGEAMRFWITSSDIRLTEKDGRLAPAAHGMRILSETTLRGAVRADPEMEAYTGKLTRHWDALAERIEPFRSVEFLARATAIAFWARDHGIDIDPFVLMLPPAMALTPHYAPVVATRANGDIGITGGVALTPEDKRTILGRQALPIITAMIHDLGSTPVAARLSAGMRAVFTGGLAVMAPALLFWIIARLALRGTEARLRYRDVLLLWFGLCLVQIAIVTVLSPLMFDDWVSEFDQNFLALAATFGIFPFLLFTGLQRAGTRFGNLGAVLRSRPGLRAATISLALLGPLFAGQFGASFAVLTVAAVGSVPTPPMNAVLSYQLATVRAMTEALLVMRGDPAVPGDTQLIPVPRSLMATFGPTYQRRHYLAEPDTDEKIHGRKEQNSNFHFDTLRRIHWPDGTPVAEGLVHYSIDGRPPF